jgi:hypothetical protein
VNVWFRVLSIGSLSVLKFSQILNAFWEWGMGNREDGIVNPNHDSLVKGFPRKRFLVKLKIKKGTMA